MKTVILPDGDGIYLLRVDGDRVRWVVCDDHATDDRLTLKEASARVLVPALAQLRHLLKQP